MKALAYLKAIVAALWPAFELWQAAGADQTITPDEWGAIGQSAAFALAVLIVPNLGYVRPMVTRKSTPTVIVAQDPDQVPADDRWSDKPGPEVAD